MDYNLSKKGVSLNRIGVIEKFAREVYSTLVLWVDIIMLCPLFLQLD